MEQSDELVAKWLLEASEQGYPPAQLQFGKAIGAGRGQKQDYVTAHKWLNLAAAAGQTEAISVRDVLAQLMTPEEIARAQTLAREWEPRGAENEEN